MTALYHSLRLKIQNVGYELLRSRYPALFLSYCLDDGRASKFFKRRYRDEQGLLERARAAAEKGIEPGVVNALLRYHQECGAPKESLAALKKLSRGAAVVVAGQQPSVGLGPLYNFFKAQAALKYAQGIDARGIPCVAVFWNHSDDVQGGSAVSLPDRENRVREVRMPISAAGVPSFTPCPPAALRGFASALAEALPGTEFAPWMGELLGLAHQGSVAESFTRLLLQTLGPFGLVVLEPRHLEGERLERLFSAHLSAPDRFSKAVDAGRAAVAAAGFEDQLGRSVGLDLFSVREGRRERVESPAAARARLSAGVALRPLLQDAVLPTCASVVGPSEAAYHAALQGAYEAFGIDAPVVIPRVTATLLEPKVSKLVEELGLKPAQIFGEEGELAAAVADGKGDVSGELQRRTQQVSEGLKQTSEWLLQQSAAHGKAVEKTEIKVREALDALSRRVQDAESRDEETRQGRMAKLVTHLRPGGQLQERVFTGLYYASLFGPTFPGKLLGTLDPFVFTHQMVSVS